MSLPTSTAYVAITKETALIPKIVDFLTLHLKDIHFVLAEDGAKAMVAAGGDLERVSPLQPYGLEGMGGDDASRLARMEEIVTRETACDLLIYSDDVVELLAFANFVAGAFQKETSDHTQDLRDTPSPAYCEVLTFGLDMQAMGVIFKLRSSLLGDEIILGELDWPQPNADTPFPN
jgi:hypothetical protein